MLARVKALLIHKGRCQKHECFLTVIIQCKIFNGRGWDVNVLKVLRRPANPLFLTLIDDYYLFPFRKSGPEREFQNTTRHGGEEYFCSYVCNGHDWVSERGLYFWVCRIKWDRRNAIRYYHTHFQSGIWLYILDCKIFRRKH